MTNHVMPAFERKIREGVQTMTRNPAGCLAAENPAEAASGAASGQQSAFPIRRGTARRLGLHQPPAAQPPPPWARTVADVITATQQLRNTAPGWQP